MSDFDREAYALEQRHACAPIECSADPYCWVALGTAESLRPLKGGTPRCGACGGKVRHQAWKTPSGLGLPAHGRLNPRAVESKRARPREPDGSVAKAQPGDSAKRRGVPAASTPASGSFL